MTKQAEHSLERKEFTDCKLVAQLSPWHNCTSHAIQVPRSFWPRTSYNMLLVPNYA